MNITISFSLDAKTDADIIRWLNRQPKRRRSHAIREKLRDGMSNNGADDIGRRLDRIERLLESGVVVASGGDGATVGDEPPDVAAALDSLGL